VKRLTRIGAAVALASAAFAGTAQAGELGGSPTSMKHQHGVAVDHHYTFLRTPAQVREYVAEGRLEELSGNADYMLNKVSFPYARREVRLFVERISADYRAATGGLLVVTSLTRPDLLQPRNAHQLSVHPAGMAVDFRVPEDASSRQWLEKTLVSMEKRGLVDATRERHPPHYHVAVFPEAFLAYAKTREAEDAAAAAMKASSITALAAVVPIPATGGYEQFAFPVNPVVGGAASGFFFLGLAAIGGAIARRSRRRSVEQRLRRG
jgi:uncharacterized protein DUF5715